MYVYVCCDEMSFLYFQWCGELQRQKHHVYEDVCYVLPTLFAQDAAVHPADLPIRSTHFLSHPDDFPITPTQAHTLLTVIRPTLLLQLTDVHMYDC